MLAAEIAGTVSKPNSSWALSAGRSSSFFQQVSLVGVKADPDTKLDLSSNKGKESFNFAEDYVAFTGAQTDDVRVDADLVFVGYGIDAPEQRWNDYKGEPADYKNKILVMLVNDPPAAKESLIFGGRRLTYKALDANLKKGHDAALRRVISFARSIRRLSRASSGLPNGSHGADVGRPMIAISGGRSWITDGAARRMMNLAGQDLDDLRRKAATRRFQPVS